MKILTNFPPTRSLHRQISSRANILEIPREPRHPRSSLPRRKREPQQTTQNAFTWPANFPGALSVRMKQSSLAKLLTTFPRRLLPLLSPRARSRCLTRSRTLFPRRGKSSQLSSFFPSLEKLRGKSSPLQQLSLFRFGIRENPRFPRVAKCFAQN